MFGEIKGNEMLFISQEIGLIATTLGLHHDNVINYYCYDA